MGALGKILPTFLRLGKNFTHISEVEYFFTCISKVRLKIYPNSETKIKGKVKGNKLNHKIFRLRRAKR